MKIEKKHESIPSTLALRFYDVDGAACELRTQNPENTTYKVTVLVFDLVKDNEPFDWRVFTQEDIQSLLPYLQAFAESGTLEPTQSPSVKASSDYGNSLFQKYSELPPDIITPVEPTLQVESNEGDLDASEFREACYALQDKNLEAELATMQEAGVAMAANIVDQGKRIEKLGNDLEEACEHIDMQEECIKTLEKEKAYCLCQIDKLEELVISWQVFAEEISDEYGDEFKDERKKLVEKTSQLLGE